MDTKSPACRMPNPLESLNLLTPAQLGRWQGLPVHWLRTPEGTWNHRFTPPTTGVSLLDTGTIGSRMTQRGRSADFDLEAGSLGLFSAGIEVKANQTGSHQAQRILVDLEANAGVRQRLFDDDLVTMPLRHCPHFRDPLLAAVLRDMLREIRHGCPNGALFAESLSVGVSLHLCRTRGVRSPPAGRERGKLNAWQWARLNELIDSDLTSDLSLSTLSAELGLSRPHFVRLFRNTAETSPHRYVVQKRVERARQLIQSSNSPLAEIAFDVGFASQSHLNRVFQETYGITPGDARKQPASRLRPGTGQ